MERNSNSRMRHMSFVCVAVSMFLLPLLGGCRTTKMVSCEQPGAGATDEAILELREQKDASSEAGTAVATEIDGAVGASVEVAEGLHSLEGILSEGDGEAEQYAEIIQLIQTRSAGPDEQSGGGNKESGA